MKWISFLWILSQLFGSNLVARASAEGGELGNAFTPFDSRIGRFTVEYAKDWLVNDLSEATSFAERAPSTSQASFFTVEVSAIGSADLLSLLESLKAQYPGIHWTSVTVGGLLGWSGMDGDLRMINLLRAPGDLLALRMRSTDGAKSEQVLSHMLGTFRIQ